MTANHNSYQLSQDSGWWGKNVCALRLSFSSQDVFLTHQILSKIIVLKLSQNTSPSRETVYLERQTSHPCGEHVGVLRYFKTHGRGATVHDQREASDKLWVRIPYVQNSYRTLEIPKHPRSDPPLDHLCVERSGLVNISLHNFPDILLISAPPLMFRCENSLIAWERIGELRRFPQVCLKPGIWRLERDQAGTDRLLNQSGPSCITRDRQQNSVVGKPG
ncbi:hypothetical protein RRG08_014877 [Elysia crispata]|uniref:Uncharacterized protein n=1 Tax=Elysia crispata TaxID=231223 RepID=A0AAE1E2G8_9GAST|nr:hypothetical protein RRG08_014877 [Elysia crispata]